MLSRLATGRLTTDRYAVDGLPNGSRVAILDIYGPAVPPATVRHELAGYEVQPLEPGCRWITLGVQLDEVEPVEE